MRFRRSVCLIFAVATVTDDVSRTLLCLEVDLTDILTDNTDTHHLHTGKETDDTGRTCPTVGSVCDEMSDDRIDQKYEAYESNKESEPCDDLDGLYGKACNAVESESEELLDGVVALASHTLVSVVVNAGALEAYHGEEAS